MNTKDKTPKQAIALSYAQQGDTAPKVVAKGSGYMAEKILTSAKQNAVPVYQNKALAGMLMAIELDSQIPPELYQAVAEVLAYIYQVDQGLGKRHK